MARSSSGKSVARAAATGGGTTYRGQMPVNWYAALFLIVVVGIGSVTLAKIEYGRTSTNLPTTNTTWHAALAFDICGRSAPSLPALPVSATSGLTTTGSGVLLIAPKTSSEAGDNATLGKFASEYTGLTLTNTTLKYPGALYPLYRNGEKCPAGTPDAGKRGVVQARSFILSTTTTKNGELKEIGGATTRAPAGLKLLNRQLITVGFGPAGSQLPKPPGTTITALLQVLAGNGPVATTTIPVPTSLPTSVPSLSVPVTTTTPPAKATTTTAPRSVTTTTKPKA
ncbi:MAG TPA: hypothetical protein VND70_06135 [Acidimicrobiales bacterium]|nr:hypothetical protein [Acidimicrobiales bacterium]